LVSIINIPIDKLIGIDWLQISRTGIDTQKNTILWQAVIVTIFHFNVNNNKNNNNSPTQKCLHVVTKDDPQARSVGGRAVHDG